MKLIEYLKRCPQLTALCTQNGWIDNDTLSLDILSAENGTLLGAVTFEEIVMEGAGCIAARVPCYGRVKLKVSENGGVLDMEVL